MLFRFFFVTLLLAASAAAQVPGDANCDGHIDDVDRTAVGVALFEGSTCSAADANSDGALSVADLPAVTRHAVLSPPTATVSVSITATATMPTATVSASATASATATATPTESPIPTTTPTRTVTPELCPTDGAALQVVVDNQTGVSPIAITLGGRLAQTTCRNQTGLNEAYEVSTAGDPVTLTGLAPGVWVHTLSVETPPTGQLEHQASLLLASGDPNTVRFIAVVGVTTVFNPADGVGNGSLRDALRLATDAPKPYRIQFDEVGFPSGESTAVLLSSALPPFSASDVTIDGIDATGTAGNRIIDAGGRATAVLTISGANNIVRGLRLRNSGANNRDVLSLSGVGAYGNLIEQCIVENAATGDGIGVDAGAGSDFLGGANVVRNCEISGASDKGIKVTTGARARIERTWVHDNINGGIQATLSGHVMARDNLVERSTGEALAQNGFSVNGIAPETPAEASELIASGNIARFNAGNGLSLRGLSTAVITDDYYAANGKDGLRVATVDVPSIAVVEGTTVACNGVNGVAVEPGSQGDFGGGEFASAGNNAFTQNNLPGGAENLLNLTGAALYAINSQWEHCGREPECDSAAIAAYDVSDHGRQTVFAPPQAHRSTHAPAVIGVRPSKGIAGDLIRISGSGFNVVDGHAADATCSDLGARNRCVPLRGNCVRLGAVPATIEAVTPTMLVVRLPFSCVRPVPLTVTTQGGGVSAPVTVCTNAAP